MAASFADPWGVRWKRELDKALPFSMSWKAARHHRFDRGDRRLRQSAIGLAAAHAPPRHTLVKEVGGERGARDCEAREPNQRHLTNEGINVYTRRAELMEVRGPNQAKEGGSLYRTSSHPTSPNFSRCGGRGRRRGGGEGHVTSPAVGGGGGGEAGAKGK